MRVSRSYCGPADPSEGERDVFESEDHQHQWVGFGCGVFVEDGSPPFKVNRGAKVHKLNADRIDSFSAGQLLRVAFGSTDNAPDSNGNVVPGTITAPKKGWLILSGSIDGFDTGDVDAYACSLTVDGGQVAGTLRVSVVDWMGSSHTDNSRENCSTTGVHQVTAGTHSFALTISGRDSVDLFGATVWALYVPFDDEGNTP